MEIARFVSEVLTIMAVQNVGTTLPDLFVIGAVMLMLTCGSLIVALLSYAREGEGTNG
ncbi:hypothetical protein OIN60_00945 [Paenibacillus sp. P96]|uniref:Uncharacterized protein n=1 Tax=Paenibacillus zeirhizosphaerae TaxID=2987519 RepID=A0ABT9FKV1_9BACL|nr:hypothetical protein [Paenibacillus sp. P96]MDP4095359.1 hypothetical protein [Paenibacillus sp. P96]